MNFLKDIFDRLTLAVFSLFSGRLRKGVVEEQYRANRAAWEKRHLSGKAYIDRQAELGDLLYGRANPLARKLFFRGRALTAAENSCEVIALYNALLAIGMREELPELLRSFSHKGICARGVFGTAPKAVEEYLREKGCRLSVIRGRQINPSKLDELSRECDAFIFSAFNRGQNPFSMVHSMCVSRKGGSYIVHNDGGRARRAKSLKEAVLGYNNGKAHPIIVLGIAHKASV